MQYEELLKALDDQVEAEREELIASARKKGDAIVKTAIQEVERRIKLAMEHQEREKSAKEEQKKRTPQQRKVSRLILQIQYELYQQSIETARKSLSNIGERSDYPQILKKLIQEAVAGFDSAAKVSVRPQDVPQIKKILEELKLKLEIVSHPGVSAGVIVSSKDGKLVRSNTLESRLDRALPHLSTQIAQVLYG